MIHKKTFTAFCCAFILVISFGSNMYAASGRDLNAQALTAWTSLARKFGVALSCSGILGIIKEYLPPSKTEHLVNKPAHMRCPYPLMSLGEPSYNPVTGSTFVPISFCTNRCTANPPVDQSEDVHFKRSATTILLFDASHSTNQIWHESATPVLGEPIRNIIDYKPYQDCFVNIKINAALNGVVVSIHDAGAESLRATLPASTPPTPRRGLRGDSSLLR